VPRLVPQAIVRRGGRSVHRPPHHRCQLGGQPAPSREEPPAARRAVQGDVVQLAPVGEREVEPGDRIAELRVTAVPSLSVSAKT
jgi:hypothetical protein